MVSQPYHDLAGSFKNAGQKLSSRVIERVKQWHKRKTPFHIHLIFPPSRSSTEQTEIDKQGVHSFIHSLIHSLIHHALPPSQPRRDRRKKFGGSGATAGTESTSTSTQKPKYHPALVCSSKPLPTTSQSTFWHPLIPPHTLRHDGHENRRHGHRQIHPRKDLQRNRLKAIPKPTLQTQPRHHTSG